MNWVDLALAVLIAISMISGIRKGLSETGFGFLAVVIALLGAAWVFPGNPRPFLVLFIALVCAGAVATYFLGKAFQSAGLGWLDQFLGGAFGLANGLLFWIVAVLATLSWGPQWPREYMSRSGLATYAVDAAGAVATMMPAEMKERVGRTYEELGRSVPPHLRKRLPPAPVQII